MGLVGLSQGYNKWEPGVPTNVTCFPYEEINGNAQGNRFDKNFVPCREIMLHAM